MTPRWKPLLALLALLPAAATAEEVMVDGIAAQVGTDIVLVSEVMQVVGATEQRMRAAGMPETDVAKLRAEGLETMIEWRLIEKIVREANLGATDAEVDATIESIANENGLSVEQLRKSVTTQDMSYERYRGEIKRELERRKVINAMVASRVYIDEAEVEALYQKQFGSQPESGTTVHLAQMMIPAAPEKGITTADACNFARGLHERISKGEAFAALAMQYSAAATQQGGDIGWLHMESMASWMRELIAPLEPEQLSAVKELPFACTFVKLLGRRDWKPVSYDDVKETLHMQLFDQKLSEEYRKWIDELRSATFIERRGYFADAANLPGQTAPATQRAFEDSLSDFDVLGGGNGGGGTGTSATP